MLPDLVSLLIFIRAVEARSLTKAAEQSHIALAAASRRIAILEARYRVSLLYRSPQGVEPTPAGVALARHARDMLQLAGKLEGELSEYARGVKGHIRIHASTSAITQNLPADLAAFSEEFSDVRIDLEEQRSGDIVEALRDGAIDVGVVMDGPALDGLERWEYGRDQLVAVVPEGHPLRGRRCEFAKAIKYDLVALDSSTVITRLLANAALALGEPLRLRMQVQSFEAVCKLVQAGLGIGVLPEAPARDFSERMALRLVRLSDAWAQRRMYVCVRDIEALPAIARKLVEKMVGLESLRKTRKLD